MKLKFSALTLLMVTALGVMAEPNTMDSPEPNESNKLQTVEVTVKGTVEKITIRVVDGYGRLGDMMLGKIEDLIRDGVDLSPVKPWTKPNVNQSAQIAHDNHFARATRWPNNTVYYIYDAQLPQTSRDAIQSGMNMITNKTAIRFVPRTNEPNFVHFYRGSDCSSFVGMQGGGQLISIANGCNAGRAAHEMMHALGWVHEHMRPDRDSYVKLNTENIKTDFLSDFTKQGYSDVDRLSDYDYDSIMHYNAWEFTKNGQKTIVPLKSGIAPERLGQRNNLSPGDVASVQKFYPGGTGQTTLNATLSAQQLIIDENRSGNLTLDLAGADLSGVRFYPDSDNTRVIAYNGIDIQAGQGNQRTVRVTPVRGAVGTANVTVRVIAANGKEVTVSFKLIVEKAKSGGGTSTGGTGNGSASKYDRSIKYKQGDIVDVNGKRYTLTVRVNNQPGGDYQIWGSYCDPTTCGENNPYTFGGWLKVYWVSAGSGGTTTGGGTTTNSGSFSQHQQYRDQDQTVYNGRTYRLTVKVDGRNTNSYPLYGGSCIPAQCQASLVPFRSNDGRSTAYWQ
ncbi:M12 family metallopeptidase [Chitinimonas sp. BJB300]|uniref:M12 family metallopeptidase n=1 Tax=Chitinimonas sp. BJB300 TaxID=1559339 RepID=UPI000C0CD7A7|nr:M12 family metallopeptidase [Chitinimonas sp. BJB300]PHV10939.1 hypothetical protein CSQ89_13545 [Chitinimonas sp. BJB300]TSJ86037.1 hypothetical protein FG002_016890 [Chitinimonas sp. BJB300]